MPFARRLACATLTLCLSAAPLSAFAAGAEDAGDYPTRAIRIIVGFTPGGAPDVLARYVAKKLSIRWGQPVAVENRPGAGSEIAAQYVAKAAPDGYTLLCITNAHAVVAAVHPKLPYDPVRDFAGITTLSVAPTLVLVSPSLGVSSVQELVSLARKEPGKLNFSSAGVGSYSDFGAEMFNKATGIKAQHIPFKGPPEALRAVMNGEVQYYLSPIGAAMGAVRSGKVKAVAVTGDSRIPQFPDIPTVAQSGFPGFKSITWTALIAPAQTPRPIITKLNTAITSILESPDAHKVWTAFGVATAPNSPEGTDKKIAEEVAALTKAAREGNLILK